MVGTWLSHKAGLIGRIDEDRITSSELSGGGVYWGGASIKPSLDAGVLTTMSAHKVSVCLYVGF